MSKFFNEKYCEIITPVSAELSKLDEIFFAHFSKNVQPKNEIIPIINEFFQQKGKRLRPAMTFLFAKAMGQNISDLHYDIAFSNELIHNATLIHDDIIDCSLIRRGEKTLNFNYDSKLAVLAGDYLLAEVLKIMNKFDSYEIRKIHNDAVSDLIQGELFQYFNRFKVLSINEYMDKSKKKTASLFEAGLVSVCYTDEHTKKFVDIARDFAQNFGIAFQIHNDLKNITRPEKISEDIQNGDYSAPIIFYAQDKYGQDVKKFDDLSKIFKNLKTSVAIDKTKRLIEECFDKAIENLMYLEDNLYRRALIDLCNLFANFEESLDG